MTRAEAKFPWTGGFTDEEARGIMALLRLSRIGLAAGRGTMDEVDLIGCMIDERGEQQEQEFGRDAATYRAVRLRSKLQRLQESHFVSGEGTRWTLTKRGLSYLEWIESRESPTDDEVTERPTRYARLATVRSARDAREAQNRERVLKLRERGIAIRRSARPSWANDPAQRIQCSSCNQEMPAQEIVFCAFCGAPCCSVNCYSPHVDRCES